jgi:WD40 repeat protein
MTSTLNPTLAKPNLITFGEPRFHTDGEVLQIAFDKDGWLCSIEETGSLRKWNPTTGQQMASYSLSDLETIWAFSRDARVLASSSDELSIWDGSSGRLLTSIAQPAWVTAIAFHPDASFVAVGYDDGGLAYWDAPGHHPVHEKGFVFHKKAISAMAISPDGKTLAAASEDKTISLWDLTAGKYIGCLVGHTDRVPALAWHPSGKYLVSAGWDTTARVWDARTLEPVILLNAHATQVHAIAFSHDGHFLACGDSAYAVRLWDFDTRKPLRQFKIPDGEIRTLAFSPDGSQLACNGDRIVHLWNPQSGQPYAEIGPRPTAKTSVALSPDGTRLMSNGGGNAVRIWNTTSRQALTSLDTPETVQTVAFSPDGLWIAGAVGRRIRLWDAAGKFIADWEGPDETITTLAFSPDGKTLASGSRDGVSVWLWRVADGEPILLIPDALDGCTIEALAFLPDNHTVAVAGIDWMATGGSNGAISLWNIAERAEVATFLDGASAVAVHPGGDIIATVSLDHSICLWDLTLKQLQQELVGHDGPVTAIAFSPDGTLLASASEDLTLRFWDAHGKERHAFEMDSQVTALAFAPDGRLLYTGHANTTCAQIQLPFLGRSR